MRCHCVNTATYRTSVGAIAQCCFSNYFPTYSHRINSANTFVSNKNITCHQNNNSTNDYCNLLINKRYQSQASVGGSGQQWLDGVLDPRYSSKHNMRRLNPDTMPHHVKATIQNDRREMGLGEVVDWYEFAQDAVYIPTRSGPLWVGKDDPRAMKFVRRQAKMKRQPLQLDRPKPGPDKAKKLEDHPFREYFTTATNLNDPLNIAANMHKAGMIAEYDIKHTAGKINFIPRPPIISIMGHVDHGKTTLLDYLRHTNVAATEAGGITQNVGAFQVNLSHVRRSSTEHTNNTATGSTTTNNANTNKKSNETVSNILTFIDTPGHAAFSAMREVGATATDVIICVISAMEGVQPQTREVISLASSSGVPLVIAITKIDRQPECDYIKDQLRAEGLSLEDDGGDVQVVQICARDGTGIEALLDAVQLTAEIAEINTPTPSRAELTVIEASGFKGGSAIAALVRCGTLRLGQFFVCGTVYGQIKAIYNEHGEKIKEAKPSTPVTIHGIKVHPKPGSIMLQVSSEKHAEKFHYFMKDVYAVEGDRETYLQYLNAEQQGKFYNRKPDNNFMRVHDTTEFILTCKAATFGMLQAMMKIIYDLPRLEGISVEFRIIEVGALSDPDVILTCNSGKPGCILLFGPCEHTFTIDIPTHVRLIEFNVLYHGIDQLKEAFVEALPKIKKVRVMARAECLQTFKASQAGRSGNAGGMMVNQGTLDANFPTFRVMRKRTNPRILLKSARNGNNTTNNNNNSNEDDEEDMMELVYEGKVKELRRFKDLVPSVDAGLECGVILYDEFAFKVGDVLEQYENYEESRNVEEEYELAEQRERTLREMAERDAEMKRQSESTNDDVIDEKDYIEHTEKESESDNKCSSNINTKGIDNLVSKHTTTTTTNNTVVSMLKQGNVVDESKSARSEKCQVAERSMINDDQSVQCAATSKVEQGIGELP